MKRIIIAVTIICVFSCKSKNIDHLKYAKIETNTLKYFVDSLLYRDHIFPFEKNSFDSSELILPPPIYDSEMYLDNGLFGGFTLYSDSVISELSRPFLDSIDLLYSTKELKQEYNILKKNYDSLFLDNQHFKIDLPKGIYVMNKDEFKRLKPDKSLFLEVKRGLHYCKNKILVQITVTKYYSGTHDAYDMYFWVGKDGIKEWFFN